MNDPDSLTAHEAAVSLLPTAWGLSAETLADPTAWTRFVREDSPDVVQLVAVYDQVRQLGAIFIPTVDRWSMHTPITGPGFAELLTEVIRAQPQPVRRNVC